MTRDHFGASAARRNAQNRDTDGEILLARFTEADVLAKELTGSKSRSQMLISRPLARRTADAPK
jgi:hypothetical protein